MVWFGLIFQFGFLFGVEVNYRTADGVWGKSFPANNIGTLGKVKLWHRRK